MHFDARSFLKEYFLNAGTLLGMMARLKDLPQPSLPAVEKWFARGSLPGEWLAVLLLVVEFETGGPVSLAKYMGRAK